jgi:MSHA biogenesis protein MshE
MATPVAKLRLGEILVEQGALTTEQLESALEQQRSSGLRLGKILIGQGLLSERGLAVALSRQLRLQYVDLRGVEIDAEIARRIPAAQARRLRALPIRQQGRRGDDPIVVGLVDPLDVDAVADLERQLDRPVEVAVVEESKLVAAIDRIYRRTAEISGLARELERDLGSSAEGSVDLGQMSLGARPEDAPVVRLLQTILADAARVRASDIHIEPQAAGVQIRFRIDGVLTSQTQLDSKVGPALVLRLKIVAGLDIAEKRLPQDGRFVAQLDGASIDIRLSTLPTQHGESVVMRLLGRQGALLSLDELGMPDAMLGALRATAERASGMVLVTGPTGSGKTSTLYALMSHMNGPQHKLMTVEDPVEIRLPGVVQVQVNEKIGLGFSKVLRSMLRQDPDVLLVGEMRDADTVETGLRAAMTGHMVLSTLHTNGAASTPARLLDMGAPAYLVAMSLNVVIAQRLVRRLCPHCSQPREPNARERAFIERTMPGFDPASMTRAAVGCGECNGTGFAGRVGVYEMLQMDEALAHLLITADSVAFSAAAKARIGDATLERHALRRALDGETTVSEAMRVAVTAVG